MKISPERALWLSAHVFPAEPALRAWLRNRLPNGLEVDDIIQDIYAKLICLDGAADIENVTGYLFRMARSIIIDHVRRSKIVSFTDISDLDEQTLHADEASPEDITMGRDELLRLGHAVAALPGKIREVFILRKVHGLPQRKVASIVGLSESTVEKHLSRSIYLLSVSLSNSGSSYSRTSKKWGMNLVKVQMRLGTRKERSED